MSGPTFIVFARYPAAGFAKTRLIPALGAHGAALAQHRMTLRTLATVREAVAAEGGTIELQVTGDPSACAQLYAGPWKVIAQRDGDLGRRLSAAMADGFRSDGPLVLLGSDCPGLTAAHLQLAVFELKQSDAVLGPATDGGYYLIGMSRPAPCLFQNIDWSTDRVANQTRVAAHAAGLALAELETLGDVDDPRDLPLLGSDYAPAQLAVTGATGTLGTHFLRYLLLRLPDLRVTAIGRPAPMATRPRAFQQLMRDQGARVTLLEHDLCCLDLSAVQRRGLTESDGLWHFAADTRLHDRLNGDAAVSTNDTAVTALLQLLSGSDRPSPFIHISTAYVCGDKTGVVQENDVSPRAFRNPYEASKFAAEQRVRSAFASGLNGCIFRPSVVVGDEPTAGAPQVKIVDQLALALFAAARNGNPLVLRLPTDAALNCVHIDWVTTSMATLAGRAASMGKTFHLTAGESLKLADLALWARQQSSAWNIVLNPKARVGVLPPESRLLDRVIALLAGYLTAGARFDRSALAMCAPELAAWPAIDVEAVLRGWRRSHAPPSPSGLPIAAEIGGA